MEKSQELPRVMVTGLKVGNCHSEICCVRDATDEEILSTYNSQKPTQEKTKVVREGMLGASVQCNNHANRQHVFVSS